VRERVLFHVAVPAGTSTVSPALAAAIAALISVNDGLAAVIVVA
jgi:hypothetical protein